MIRDARLFLFIEYRGSLSEQNEDRDKFILILANPPFKGSLDAGT